MLDKAKLDEAMYVFSMILPTGDSKKKQLFEAQIGVKLADAIPMTLKFFSDGFMENQELTEGYFDFIIAAIQYSRGEITKEDLYSKVDWSQEEYERIQKLLAIKLKKTKTD